MNLLGRAARAAEEFDNLWLKETTPSELRGLEASMRGSSEHDPEIIRRARAHVETRRRLGLPAVDCTARRPGGCHCLTHALVELEVFASPGLAKVTKKELLARSSMLHKSERKPRRKPKPPTAHPLAQMPADAAQSPPQPPQPSTETSEPLPTPQPRRRPVRRTPKWFDEDEGGSIIDRIF